MATNWKVFGSKWVKWFPFEFWIPDSKKISEKAEHVYVGKKSIQKLASRNQENDNENRDIINKLQKTLNIN